MKRFLLLIFVILLIITTVFFSFSYSSSASDSSSEKKPGYTNFTSEYFNDYYFYSFAWSYIFPTGLTGVNADLSGFYPFIVSYQDRYIVFFAKSYSFTSSSGQLILNLRESFSFISSDFGYFDVSAVDVPSSLIDLTVSFTLEGFNLLDNLGRICFLTYLPFTDDISSTGIDVVNQFIFPTFTQSELDSFFSSLSSSDEITYSQVFSTEQFSYEPEGYSYDDEEFGAAIDVEAALSNLDDGIAEGKNGFHALFDRLSSVFQVGPIIFILLTVSFAFFVLGQL